MDGIEIVEVDERDSGWERPNPRFRVYLQKTSGSYIGGWTATYEIIGADIVQTIDWAQRRAGDSLVYSVALVYDDLPRYSRSCRIAGGGLAGRDVVVGALPRRN